jgi:heme-degrading monooxygenase HmoA
MHARVSFYEGVPGGDTDTAVKGFEDALGQLQEMEGHRRATLLVDRDNGKAITITYWETEEDMQASVEQTNRLRQQAADTGGLSISGVENYEVAIESGR